MKAIFVTGTAGSGKSLLTSSNLLQWYRNSSVYPLALNLSPGAISLPYTPEVDVRDDIDIAKLMESDGPGSMAPSSWQAT